MTDSRNVAIATPIIVLFILAIASNAGAVLIVNELSGTFGIIGLNPADETWFELANGVVLQTADDNVTGLVLADVGVDLTGWTANGDTVAIDSSTLIIQNPATLTEAVFNVTSVALTQILSDPIGVGYMELNMTLASNDLTFAGEEISLPSEWQVVIVYNGLVIETDGTASLNALGSASFSAIPEPASLALLLGGLVLLRKFR